MNAEEFDRHLISYHEGGNDYRYCFSKQEVGTIKNELNGYDKAIDDFIKAVDKHCGYYAGECRNLTRDDLICIANNMKLRSD